jgi:purine-binding chemotaxis protein CheW
MNAPVEKALLAIAAAAASDEQSQYLTFMLGGETFAIGILAIKEIIEFDKLTTVPMMPRFVRGVINLRGAVVPVIDLSARFGREVTTAGRRTCIVIVEVAAGEGSQDVGVLVDAVNEVLEIPVAQIEPAPAFGARVRSEFIAGMGKVDGKFVIILNTAHVLSAEEMGAIAETAETL